MRKRASFKSGLGGRDELGNSSFETLVSLYVRVMSRNTIVIELSGSQVVSALIEGDRMGVPISLSVELVRACLYSCLLLMLSFSFACCLHIARSTSSRPSDYCFGYVS